MIDVSKIKPGDELEFCRVKVVKTDGSDVPIKIAWPDGGQGGDGDWFRACRFARHIPALQLFSAGDRVTWAGGLFGDVIAIAEEHAWIKDGDIRHTVHLANLRHANAPAEGEAKPFSFGDHVQITRLSTVVYRFLAYVRDGRCAVWNDESQSCCWFAASDLSRADVPADEIVVTEEEASRAFDFFYDSESGACEGSMQKTLVDFLKRRKGAGR